MVGSNPDAGKASSAGKSTFPCHDRSLSTSVATATSLGYESNFSLHATQTVRTKRNKTLDNRSLRLLRFAHLALTFAHISRIFSARAETWARPIFCD
jgi:hypothetical protein